MLGLKRPYRHRRKDPPEEVPTMTQLSNSAKRDGRIASGAIVGVEPETIDYDESLVRFLAQETQPDLGGMEGFRTWHSEIGLPEENISEL